MRPANEITIVKCPCDYARCKDRHLEGIGKFVQGSGFTQEEAERVVAGLKLLEERQSSFIPFNANDYVWVRLTELGWQIYDRHEAEFGGAPKERTEWTRFQLWELMQIFGSFLHLGAPEPFGMEIRLEVRAGP